MLQITYVWLFCTLFLVMPLNNMQKQTTFIFEQTTKFNQKLYNFIHIFTYKFLYFLYFFFLLFFFNILLFRLIFDFGLFIFCFCCWVFFVFCFGKLFFLLLLFFYACVLYDENICKKFPVHVKHLLSHGCYSVLALL